MFVISPLTALILNGLTWLIVGVSLLYKGFFLVTIGILTDPIAAVSGPVIAYFYAQTRNIESSMLFLVFIGLLLGLIKAKLVLSKTIKKTFKRLVLKTSPIKLTDVFTLKYLVLIGFMASLGMSMKYLPIPIDIKAIIDVAVGAALITGAFTYFRYGVMVKAQLAAKK